ncbi:MAG: cytochrome P450, partial [Gaiellales bacterium]
VNVWMLTRWDDVEHAGAHPELFSAETPSSPVELTFGSPTVLTCDGAVHKELRASIDPKFRPRVVDGYVDDLIEPIASELLDRFQDRGTAELMAEYLEPISVLGLGQVLGLGDVDGDTLRRWFASLAQGATNYELDPAKQAIGDGAAAEIRARLAPLLDRLERQPDDSAISHMLHAGRPEGEPRPRELVLPSLLVILLGGMQEPGHGAGSSLAALLADPAQAAEVAADPAGLVPLVIEEGLRLIAPIGTQLRSTTEDVEIGGTTIPAGEPVALVIASANRDEDRFGDPDRFDLHRERHQHAAFGFGRHFCSGHAFARRQEQIALRLLFERLPDVRLDPDRPPVLRGWEFRAPTELHVRFAAR